MYAATAIAIINPSKLITSLAEERKRKRKEKTQSGLPKTVCFQFIEDCTRKRKQKNTVRFAKDCLLSVYRRLHKKNKIE